MDQSRGFSYPPDTLFDCAEDMNFDKEYLDETSSPSLIRHIFETTFLR
jgi:hypothetical protein